MNQREEWMTGAGWSDAAPARGEACLPGSLESWQAGARERVRPVESGADSGAESLEEIGRRIYER